MNHDDNPQDDLAALQSDHYLWDKSGLPDPQVVALETTLGRFRHEQPLAATARPHRKHRRKLIWLGALAAAAIALVFAWDVRMRMNWQPGNPWAVEALAGSPRVGDANIAGASQLPVGQTLETDAKSSARLRIANIGVLDVQPDSRLVLLYTRANRHRIALEHGTVEAHVWAPPFSFAIDTPSSTLFDLGCAYVLHVDPNGYGTVHVTSGWVEFQLEDRQTLIPAGAEVATRPGLGPGTPYFSDAPATLKSALAQFDTARDDPATRAAMLQAILTSARRQDALTLMNLLREVPREQRGEIFDRLAQLVPPPPHVTRDAVIALEQPAMEAYWNVVDPGNPKSWIVNWKDALTR